MERIMQNVDEIWQKILEKLELRISTVSYTLWIKTIKPLEIDENDNFVVAAQSVSAKNQILRNFLDKILDCANDVVGHSTKITVLDPNEEIEYLKNNKIEEPEEKEDDSNPFIEEFTFDNFVVGKSNQFVYTAAQAVAQNPGGNFSNPLFIYGNSGLGKTHLLHAIGNYIRKYSPNLKIKYVTNFQTPTFLHCLQPQKIRQFWTLENFTETLMF